MPCLLKRGGNEGIAPVEIVGSGTRDAWLPGTSVSDLWVVEDADLVWVWLSANRCKAHVVCLVLLSEITVLASLVALANWADLSNRS